MLRTVPRIAWRLVWFAVSTLAVLISLEVRLMLAAPMQKRSVRDKHTGMWSRQVLRILGLRLHVHGDIPASDRGQLVYSNHRAPLDIPVMLAVFGGRVLGQSAAAAWPLLGRASRIAGTIFVDRSSKASGTEAIQQIRSALSEGDRVVVFPEGTIHTTESLGPFRYGVFSAASGLDVDLIPVGIAYGYAKNTDKDGLVRQALRLAAVRHADVIVAIGPAQQASAAVEAMTHEGHMAVQALVEVATLKLAESEQTNG